METIAWVVAGAALWLLVAVPSALLLGRFVRQRDHQKPTGAGPGGTVHNDGFAALTPSTEP